jgi:hypothetical protein
MNQSSIKSPLTPLYQRGEYKETSPFEKGDEGDFIDVI